MNRIEAASVLVANAADPALKNKVIRLCDLETLTCRSSNSQHNLARSNRTF
jgi:hypothetical protein